MRARVAIAAVALALSGCGGDAATAAVPSPTGTPADDEAPKPTATVELPPAGPPRVSLVVRAGLAPGRPVPYRLTLENRTRDVLIPILATASDGDGGTSWAREVAGEVAYDAETDRYVETPVYGVQPGSRTDTRQSIFRSALFPGETLVEEFEVRYGHTGAVEEKVKVEFHQLSPAEFERNCYVSAGDTLPRRYGPVGRWQDPSARRGALLAGFYLRTDKPPASAVGEIALTLPALPPAIATRIKAAGFEPDRAMAADWAGGWLAGGAEHSVLVTAAGATKPLPGVPFDALQVIDGAGADVSFCVTGAKRDDLVPLFPGREIVPFKCLHVSVPRKHILTALERVSAAGFAVTPTDFQAREALDVKKVAGPRAPPKPVAPPAGTPPAKPSPVVSKTPKPTPSATPTPAATSAETPEVAPTQTPEDPG